MRWVSVVAILISISSVSAAEIREFGISTLERLGRELSRRDFIAARAADIVGETQSLARSLKMRGWITELRKDGDTVYLIAETASGPCLAYTVTFSGSGKPLVQDRRGEAVSPGIAIRYKAWQTTAGALQGKFFDARYNFEVLDDPDGSGFLVYGLASTNKVGEQNTGGHYRVTVSADGSKVERVDALSHGIIKETPKLPKGAKQMAIATSQLVSNVPVETFLYSSELYKLPIFVATKDGSMWVVANGLIHKFTKPNLMRWKRIKRPNDDCAFFHRAESSDKSLSPPFA